MHPQSDSQRYDMLHSMLMMLAKKKEKKALLDAVNNRNKDDDGATRISTMRYTIV